MKTEARIAPEDSIPGAQPDRKNPSARCADRSKFDVLVILIVGEIQQIRFFVDQGLFK